MGGCYQNAQTKASFLMDNWWFIKILPYTPSREYRVFTVVVHQWRLPELSWIHDRADGGLEHYVETRANTLCRMEGNYVLGFYSIPQNTPKTSKTLSKTNNTANTDSIDYLTKLWGHQQVYFVQYLPHNPYFWEDFASKYPSWIMHIFCNSHDQGSVSKTHMSSQT